MNHTQKKTNIQEGKVALVTGAARRIGACIAKTLHEAGYRVAVHVNRSRDVAVPWVATLNERRPDSAAIFEANLACPVETTALIPTVMAWASRLDVLVNNASLFEASALDGFDDDQFGRLFTVNVKAPYILSLQAFPFLALTDGVIINITDSHLHTPLKRYPIYSQTKAALKMQTEALARELAPNVRVNAVAPGSIAWPEGDNALSAEIKAHIIEETPLKRHGNPEDIADAVLSLIQLPFVTGQSLVVDGGRLG